MGFRLFLWAKAPRILILLLPLPEGRGRHLNFGIELPPALAGGLENNQKGFSPTPPRPPGTPPPEGKPLNISQDLLGFLFI